MIPYVFESHLYTKRKGLRNFNYLSILFKKSMIIGGYSKYLKKLKNFRQRVLSFGNRYYIQNLKYVNE